MSFLYPLFLLGGLAVALPVVFHLIRRQSRDRVDFSAVQFLQPSPPTLTRKSRLQHLWLLILRCLILLLLALAFSRPFLRSVVPDQAPGAESVYHLYLVDVSASMGREGALEEAREILSRRLAEAGAAASGAVYSFDTRLRSLISFEEWRAAAPSGGLAGLVPDLEATHRGTRLGSALTSAMELLENASQREEEVPEDIEWQIHVISDMQAGANLEGLQGLEWPGHCWVRFHPVEVEGETNVGIHVLPASELASGLSEQEAYRIRISSSGASRRETFGYGWAGQEERQSLYLPPGQSRILHLAPGPGSGSLIEVDGDDHGFDNAVWQIPVRARESLVLYLGEDGEEDPDGPLFYLRKAFQQTRHHVVSVESRPAGPPLDPALLEQARLVVVADAPSPGTARQLADAARGGAVLLLALHRDGMDAALPALSGFPGLGLLPDRPRDYALLGEIDFGHPLFSGFADPRYSNFAKIRFWNHRLVDLQDEGRFSVAARFDSGHPAILDLLLDQGRLVVACFGWQRGESNFALSTKFVPFLYSLLDMGLGAGEIRSQYLVGQEVDVSLAGGPGADPRPGGVGLPGGPWAGLLRDGRSGDLRPGVGGGLHLPSR